MRDASPLESIRRKLALAIGENAVFDGWGEDAVVAAANQAGINPDQAMLAAPRTAAGLIQLYIAGVDRALADRCSANPDFAAAKIREKIRFLVWTRLEIMAPAREAVRRALSHLAMPQNLALAARSGWSTADLMWRLAGDTATDYNHYTKRLTLSGVYASTLLVWLDDKSDGQADTAAFLDRRIEDVMKIEKAKAKWRGSSDRRPSLTRFLGRLRYPVH